MSTAYGPYDMAAPNAVYANRALNHAYWALGVTAVFMLLRSFGTEEALLEALWALWMLFEFSQIIRYGVKSIKAGIRDGRVLAISIHEGAFVSIPEGAVL